MGRSSLQWYYKRSMETLRYEGFQVLLWRLLKMCLSPIGDLGIETLCHKDLTQPLGEIRAKVGVTFSQATESDIEVLTTLAVRRFGPKASKKRDALHEMLLQRFRDGNKCFVGKIGTEIVNYNWIFFNPVIAQYKTGYCIHLKNDEAHCDDAYTSEPWRGKGIHTAGQNQMLLFLQQAGYRRASTFVPTDGKSSKKTHHRLGWEFTGTMLYFIPRGAKKAWIWRVNGTLAHFVEEQIPVNEA